MFLLEFSNAQSRIRELTHFSTEQSSMYLNLMGGKAFNLYSVMIEHVEFEKKGKAYKFQPKIHHLVNMGFGVHQLIMLN